MCKVADHENHVRWIYLTTVLCMGECQKYARKTGLHWHLDSLNMGKMSPDQRVSPDHISPKTGLMYQQILNQLNFLVISTR